MESSFIHIYSGTNSPRLTRYILYLPILLRASLLKITSPTKLHKSHYFKGGPNKNTYSVLLSFLSHLLERAMVSQYSISTYESSFVIGSHELYMS